MTSIITNNGKKVILNRAFKSTPDYTTQSKFKIGRGQATPIVTDTDLTEPIPISGTESVDDCETADWTDSTDMTSSLNSTTFKEGSNGLNLTKDGTSSANASLSKTTTSRDFTSKEFSVWVYIIDATALAKLATTSCLSIRFGSDNSNYYQWVKDKADLSTGWNLITGLTSSNADATVGTPSISACDYTFIELTADASATVWSAGDFVMDDLKLISSEDYSKTFTSTTIDESTLQVTIRCDLSSTEANGYNINGIGFVNTDGTTLTTFIADFTSESKSDSDEFIFTTKLRYTT